MDDAAGLEEGESLQAARLALQRARAPSAPSDEQQKLSIAQAEAEGLRCASNHLAEGQMVEHLTLFLERNGPEANFAAWIALLHPENVTVDHRIHHPASRHAAIWKEAQQRDRSRSTEPDAPPSAFVTRLDGDACSLWTAGPRPFDAALVEGEGLAREAPLEEGETAETVTLWVDHPRQPMVGFGAAMTESAAAVIMSSRWRDVILDDLFLPVARGGAGLSVVRVPIGSSDYSLAPPGAATHHDDEGRPFDAARDFRFLVPALRAARARNPQLQLVAAPWSAPRWMKTSNALVGGTLRPDCYQPYCRYLLQWILHFEAAGLRVHALTMQNEPYHGGAAYPCMALDADAQARLAHEMVPLLRRNGLDTLVLAHDHNYAHAPSAIALLERATRLDGSAWHAYEGDAAALCHATIQKRPIYVTEQTAHGARPRDAAWVADVAFAYEQVLLRPVVHGACCGLQWNLALDDAFGPVLPGGPAACRGVVEAAQAGGAHERSPEFYALAHLCHAARAGCWHVTTCVDRPHAVAAVGFAHRPHAGGGGGDGDGDGGGGGGGGGGEGGGGEGGGGEGGGGEGGGGEGGGGGDGGEGGRCGCVLHNKTSSPMRVTLRAADDAHSAVLRVVRLPPRAVVSLAELRLAPPLACVPSRAPPRPMPPARFDFPSAFYLRSRGHQTFLAAHGEARGLVYASAAKAPAQWERWVAVEGAPRQFWLRSCHGTLLGANERGELVALPQVNTLAALALTVFVFDDGCIGLLADRGAVHMPARGLNGLGDWGPPLLKRTHIGAWEAFDVLTVQGHGGA